MKKDICKFSRGSKVCGHGYGMDSVALPCANGGLVRRRR